MRLICKYGDRCAVTTADTLRSYACVRASRLFIVSQSVARALERGMHGPGSLSLLDRRRNAVAGGNVGEEVLLVLRLDNDDKALVAVHLVLVLAKEDLLVLALVCLRNGRTDGIRCQTEGRRGAVEGWGMGDGMEPWGSRPAESGACAGCAPQREERLARMSASRGLVSACGASGRTLTAACELYRSEILPLSRTSARILSTWMASSGCEGHRGLAPRRGRKESKRRGVTEGRSPREGMRRGRSRHSKASDGLCNRCQALPSPNQTEPRTLPAVAPPKPSRALARRGGCGRPTSSLVHLSRP